MKLFLQQSNVIPLDKWRRGEQFRRLMQPVRNTWLDVVVNPKEDKKWKNH